MPHPLRVSGLTAVLSMLVLALAACTDRTAQPTASAGAGDEGGTIVISTAADAGSLLPTLVTSITDREVTDLLFDRLAEIGYSLNTVGDKDFSPQLAERWEWASDSMSIVFHINPKARWHDGAPVRASDVRYSFGLIRDSTVGSPIASLVSNVDSVSVRDSLTAVVWYKHHVPEQFYDFVYQVVVVPEHILSNTPGAQLKSADVTRRGIGSGQFRLAKWEPGVRLELVADTANYRGRPKVDRILFLVSPDYNAAATRFFSGEADVLEGLRADLIPKMATDTTRRVIRFPSLNYSYLRFNAVDPTAPSRPHPIFGDRAVRRALSMAIDRRAMLRNVFDTIGHLAYGPFPTASSLADSTLSQLPYDTMQARALLNGAGWRVGPDGIRVKNGRRLEFALATPSSSAIRHQYAVLIQDALRRVGAAVRIDESDFPSFTAGQLARTHDAEMGSYNPDPSVSALRQSWATAGIGGDGQNYGSYSNPVVDALIDSAMTSFDAARTEDFAHRAFNRIIQDAPAVWLYENPSMAGVARRIHTTRIRADGYWSGLADWFIPAAERTARDRLGLRPTP